MSWLERALKLSERLFIDDQVVALMRAENDDGKVLWFRALHFLHIRRLFTFNVHGQPINVRSATPDIGVAFLSLGAELDDVIALVPPDADGLIVDGGGYIGTTALRLALAFPKATVVTIEPSSSNIEVLRRNVQDVPNIKVVQAAIAPQSGYAELKNIGTAEWGFSLLSAPSGRGVTIDKVRTIDIRSLMDEYGEDEIVLLKLDIEGAEAGVLSASEDWLPSTKLMVAELHEWLAPGVDRIFSTATSDRKNISLAGEKVMSIRKDQQLQYDLQ